MLRLAIIKEFEVPSNTKCECGKVTEKTRKLALELNQKQFAEKLQAEVGKKLKSKYTRENILKAVQEGFMALATEYEKETIFIK